MHTDEFLIDKAKKLFESNTGWGNSTEWTNQDFIILSEKIQERTGVALSHVTLKRVWGKVKYDSLPNTHTLDTLVQFLGYSNWRDFKSQNGNGKVVNGLVHEIGAVDQVQQVLPGRTNIRISNKNILLIITVMLLTCLVFYLNKGKTKVSINDYTFSSKKVISEGVPNSVIFNFDASKAPYDSVIIQQSWDKALAVKVPKNQRQHTSIYYYPDYYKAKLIVGGKTVSMHRLLIKSNGWMPMVIQKPVPVYFNLAEALSNGKLSLSADQIRSKNIKMQPEPPSVLYTDVQDFGEIYSNDFVFETSIRNDYSEGAGACQNTTIYILCEGTAVGISLCAKGCISDLNLLFTNFLASGKQEDLSAFGVDFRSFVKVKVISNNGKAIIYLDGKPVYTVTHDILRSKIVGFDFIFQGAGSVDYVRLSNGNVNYKEDF